MDLKGSIEQYNEQARFIEKNRYLGHSYAIRPALEKGGLLDPTPGVSILNEAMHPVIRQHQCQSGHEL